MQNNPPSYILSDFVCNRLIELLDIPRSGASKHPTGVGWLRRHKQITVKSFKNKIRKGFPIALSFYRYETVDKNKYRYVPSVKFACVDFDLKGGMANPLSSSIYPVLTGYVTKTYSKLDEMGLSPCITHSGHKGFHVWLFFDEEIDVGYVNSLMKSALSDIGLVYDEGKWRDQKFVDEDGKYQAEIEPLLKGAKHGGIVKIPFSRHQNNQKLIEVPISIDEVSTFEPFEMDNDEKIAQRIEVFNTWKITQTEIIKKQYKPHVNPYPRDNILTRKRKLRLPVFDIPSEGKRQKEIDRIYTNLPCFRQAADDSYTRKSPYEHRTPIVQILSSLGFEKEEIAIWIKNNINNEEDNMNPGVMIEQINYWSQFDYLAKCSSYSNPDYKTFVCPGPCGRGSPLEDLPLKDSILNIPKSEYLTIDAIMDRCRDNNSNLQLYKTTRSGATTGIVINAMRNKDRVCVIVPTTKIVETVDKALKIYRDNGGDEVFGISFPDHRTSCLKMMMAVDDDKDTFNTEKPAISRLCFVTKPSCKDCKYNSSHLELDPYTVLKSSDLEERKCLFRTGVDNLDSIDLMVITDKKVNALVHAKSAIEGFDTEGDSDAEFILDWIENSDVIVLDEVSTYIDKPDSVVKLLEISSDEKVTKFDIVRNLNDEMRQIENFKSDNLSERMRETIDTLIDEFHRMKRRRGVSIYTREVDNEEKIDIKSYLNRIQVIARKTNESLNIAFESILIFEELEWIVVEVPDPDCELLISIYIRPKFAENAFQFIRDTSSRIVAADATMPLVEISDVLGVPFVKENLDDPLCTSDSMKIIPFYKHIASPLLLDSEKMFRYMEKFIEKGHEIFGDKFVIASPSKRLAKTIWSQMDKYDLDIMWYRSSESIGVENEKRVMLGLTSPYTPKKTYNWLKEAVYPDLLEDISSEQLWSYSMIKSLFQTLSRVKDPFGKERSAFIGFGQSKNELELMCKNVVSPPEVVDIHKSRNEEENILIPLLTAKFWIDGDCPLDENGIKRTLNRTEQKISSMIWRDPHINTRKIINSLSVKGSDIRRTVESLRRNVLEWRKL